MVSRTEAAIRIRELSRILRRAMAVVLAQVSFEHLDDYVQVRLDGRDVLAQPCVCGPKLFVCGPKLFVGALLGHSNLGHAVDNLADDRSETNEPGGHLIDL